MRTLALAALLVPGCLPNGPPTGLDDKPQKKPVPAATTPAVSSGPPRGAALAAMDPPLTEPFSDDFERPQLGPEWRVTGPLGWRIDQGRLCGRGARNKGVWLAKRLPTNARIEVDATALSPEGDLKLEVFGDGASFASTTSYTNATSYLAVFGGWKNSLHVLARKDEHGQDRLALEVDAKSDDPRARPVGNGQTYRLRVERRDGRTVTFAVDDLVLHTFVDPEPLSGAGHDHLGFNDWEAPVCFDNLKIVPL